ncbi:MAG: hypothetical protein JWR19_4109 [Pedosphaera sp.]|nr:hypothetical protein [Pedosphaera sp.]
MHDNGKVAFALGGLAGNNAHGAGFLAAALKKRIHPAMVSCTSGQILWVYRYLLCRNSGKKCPSLKVQLQNDINRLEPFRNPDFDLSLLALYGKQGVYRPAGGEYMADAWRNVSASLGRALFDKNRPFVARRFLEMFPCRLLVPEFPDNFFNDISAEMNQTTDIGIIFNSYDPSSGREYVYLNERARRLLGATSNRPDQYQHGKRSSYRDQTIYRDISPEAVRDGIWLYHYGFNGDKERFVDGAYFREIMLSELTHADTIYVVRPMHLPWTDPLPHNYPEMEDLKTKVGFNGSYAGERYQISLMNKLLKSGTLKARIGKKPKYHHIELHPIEMKQSRGYFGYVFEDVSVFNDAFDQSMAALS